MTTKPESPDSGVLPCAHCGAKGIENSNPNFYDVTCSDCGSTAPNRTIWNSRTHGPNPYTASAGDQAVAPFGYIRHDDTARGYFTSMHTQIQGFEDDEFDTPIYLSAKPAQVGQKYRTFTLADSRDLFNFALMAKGDDLERMLSALQSIGAVVPAQEGDR